MWAIASIGTFSSSGNTSNMQDGNWLGLWIVSLSCVVLALLSATEWWLATFDMRADREHRWPTNFALLFFSMVVSAIAPLSVVLVAGWSEVHGTGLMNLIALPWTVRFILSIFAMSFAGYLMHYLSHAVPLLWRLHSIHHADSFVDASTSLRMHPLEPLVVTGFLSLVAVLTGSSASAILLYTTVEILFAIFNHSRFRLPVAVERRLSWFLVTPSFHHVHHSSHQPETDSNYGNVLTIWDQLLGTFSKRHSSVDSSIHYGLAGVPGETAHDLDAMLLHPFRT
jgi:sterol desaturase/sphingolipid hydroxylase (fatty acid hydroxylase superfamily)